MTPEERLVEFISSTRHDPYAYAMGAYEWGAGDLADSDGPREWQKDILQTIGKRLSDPTTRFTPIQIAVSSGHGVGKILSNKINDLDTPRGVRKWADIEVGDYVFGSDGKPTRVTAKYPHKDWHFYKVIFSDGTSTYAGLEHQWQVTTKMSRDRNLGCKTVTTQEMMNHLKRRYQVPLTKPVDYPERRSQLHPYIMGYILGNGSLRTASAVRISCYDEELYGYIQTLLPKTCTLKGKAKNYQHISSNEGVGKNIILNELTELGIHGTKGPEKYIPDFYKYNSVLSRVELLRGLMDSDGTISPRVGDNGRKGYKVQYSTSSPQLRDDIIWLVRSLGGVSNYSTDRRRGTNSDKIRTGQNNYEVHINLPSSINPFFLKRKREMYDDYVATVKHEPIKIVRSIEFDHIGEGHCITVDASDHLYVANDFIVTHNSSLISIITNWAMSTCVDCKVVVTANTETQLRTKTWPELRKWSRLSINSHWFDQTATSIKAVSPDHESTWRADAITWSETNTEAFAGLHNKGRRIVLIFDESSAIADKVWEVAEGALTDEDTEIIWIAFGNPTKNTGRFMECFGRLKHRWMHRQIDSRTVEGTNKAQLAQWVDDYGEDSDFVRVRVKGEFPRAGSMQFIASDVVEAARKRLPVATLMDPVIMGVDVARYGSDSSVIVIRRGRDAVSIPWVKLRNVDTMTLAAKIVELANIYQPDAIFVDGGGVGGGVIDRLRMLRKNVIEVQFGGSADRALMTVSGAVNYANKRAEMWGYMRDWLQGGSIPDDPDLAMQLTGVEYGYTVKRGQDAIILEKKSDMKRRGLSSPDEGDALCFVAGTLISTPHGKVPIEKMQIGDEVFTPFGKTRVGKVWVNQTDKITTTQFSNGSSLAGKGQHKIFVWKTGQCRLDALSLTDELSVEGSGIWKFLNLLAMADKNIQFKPLVDTIRAEKSVTGLAFFTAMSGLIISGLSQKAIMSITRIMTGLTMISPTLDVCMAANTNATTWLNSTKPVYSSHLPMNAANEQPNGMDLSKEESGIVSILCGSGKKLKLRQKIVLFATKNIRPIWEILSIAGERVSSVWPIADTLLKLEYVSGAAKNLWQTVTGRCGCVLEPVLRESRVRLLRLKGLLGNVLFATMYLKLQLNVREKPIAVVGVATEEGSSTKVYNLTLEKHNAYYANGILVYNCLTFAYPVEPSDHTHQMEKRPIHQLSYDPLSLEHIRKDVGGTHKTSYDPLPY